MFSFSFCLGEGCYEECDGWSPTDEPREDVTVLVSAVHCRVSLTLWIQQREREMFYLTTHSTHFIYGYMASDMVKDHSDSEKGNLLPPHRLLLSINSKVFLYAPSHRQDNTYHNLCYTSRGALAGTRNSVLNKWTKCGPVVQPSWSIAFSHPSIWCQYKCW